MRGLKELISCETITEGRIKVGRNLCVSWTPGEIFDELAIRRGSFGGVSKRLCRKSCTLIGLLTSLHRGGEQDSGLLMVDPLLSDLFPSPISLSLYPCPSTLTFISLKSNSSNNQISTNKYPQEGNLPTLQLENLFKVRISPKISRYLQNLQFKILTKSVDDR